MTNAFSLFRTLIIYSICLPLAIIVGYFLATTPTDFTSFVTIVILLCLMTIPLFLRWHYPWMILTWNMSAILFFFPGKPFIGWFVILISLFISVLQYILNRQLKFISAPIIVKPLLFILLVVVLTARLTGGIGLNVLGGGENVGGKRYLCLILAVMGFFALTAVKIPPQRRKLYIFLFFGGALSMAVANLAYVVTPSLSFIFLVFPTDQGGADAVTNNAFAAQYSIVRLAGLSTSSVSIIFLLLAIYGFRGLLDMRKSWRLPTLILLIGATLYGGFRSQIIMVGLILTILFFMEGLARTRLLPAFVLLFVLGIAIALPSLKHMPLVVQRSLAFLPDSLIDPEAADNANASTDWRLQMWAEVLPEVPQYLILGKGLGINSHELDMQRDNLGGSQYSGAMLAGDYHNGPLSLIIPFGLFGVAGFIWFLVAGTKVLYRNYKFGDPDLLLINRFFLAQFIMKMIVFFFIFGSFYGDLLAFTGVLGFSIALNHGVAKPAAAEPVARPVFGKFKLADAVH